MSLSIVVIQPSSTETSTHSSPPLSPTDGPRAPPINSHLGPATSTAPQCPDCVLAYIQTSDCGDNVGALDPANGNLYVASLCGNGTADLLGINGTSNTIVTRVPVGNASEAVAYDSMNGFVYVAHWDNGVNAGFVSVVNTSNNSVVTNVSIPTSYGLAYDPVNGDMYDAYADGGPNVDILSGTNNSIIGSLGQYLGVPTYDPSNGDFYSPPEYGSSGCLCTPLLYVFSAASNAYVTYVPNPTETLTGNFPSPVFDPANGDLYQANIDTNSVNVISGASNTVISTLSLGSTPTGITYDASNGNLYVALEQGGTLDVISGTSNTITGAISDPGSMNAPLYDPANEDLYELNPATNGVDILSGINGTVLGNISVGGTVVTASFSGLSYIPLYYDSQNAEVYYPHEGLVTAIASHPNLSVGLTPSVSQVSAGSPVTITASVSGALPPYAYTFSAPLDAGCSTPQVNSSTIVCTPTRAGWNFSVSVNVTDPLGGSFPATTSLINVTAPPTGLLPSTTLVNVGAPVTFNTTITGSLSSLSYAYSYPSAAGCTPSTGPSIVCTPSRADWGFNVSVNVTDPLGGVWNATSATVTTSTVSAALSASRTSVDVGETFVLTTSVTGDSASLSDSYTTPSSAGCAASSGPTVTCTPTASGNLTLSNTVKDSEGNSWSTNSVVVSVASALTVKLSDSNSTPLLGQTVAFVANASGGASPYSYAFVGFPPGCVSEDKPSVGCLPTQADFYNISVTVTDLNGGTASANVSMHVIFDFNVIVPTSTSAGNPFTISVNTNETFSGGTAVVPAAGFGAFTYNYTGLPPGCTSQNAARITCTPSQVGTYHITVSVHDQVGDHNTHTVVVNVVPAKTAPGFLGLTGNTGYVVVGGSVAAVVIAVALFVRLSRRFKRGRPREALGKANPPSSPGKRGEPDVARDGPSPEQPVPPIESQ